MADLEELSEDSTSPEPNVVQKTEQSKPENKRKSLKVKIFEIFRQLPKIYLAHDVNSI